MRTAPLSVNVRKTVFRRLLAVFCVSVILQTATYLAFCALLVTIAELVPEGVAVPVNIGVLVLRLLAALPLGYFAARLSYSAMRARLPAHRRLPVQPAIIAAAIAACLAVVIDWAARPEFTTWATVSRDVAAAAIWVFAAQRAFVRLA